jgi:hypothetical protein
MPSMCQYQRPKQDSNLQPRNPGRSLGTIFTRREERASGTTFTLRASSSGRGQGCGTAAAGSCRDIVMALTTSGSS